MNLSNTDWINYGIPGIIIEIKELIVKKEKSSNDPQKIYTMNPLFVNLLVAMLDLQEYICWCTFSEGEPTSL